jgi:SAM-dependent methyltransferase
MAHDHHSHQHDHGDLAELLDLDAEIRRDETDELTAWIAAATTGPITRILDIGAGTGAGTFALLRRFPDAVVTAVDADPDMLHRLEAAAKRHGAAVRTKLADLDTDRLDREPVDLVWASASMHHMGDPERVLRDIAATLRPGGTLALVEVDSFPRFLPDGAADGVETRLQAAADAARAAELPHMGADWAVLLERTGFRVVGEREFALRLSAPPSEQVRRYAHASLSRLRTRIAGALTATQAAVLDELLDGDGPESLRRRDDLSVRSTRTAWVARPSR